VGSIAACSSSTSINRRRTRAASLRTKSTDETKPPNPNEAGKRADRTALAGIVIERFCLPIEVRCAVHSLTLFSFLPDDQEKLLIPHSLFHTRLYSHGLFPTQGKASPLEGDARDLSVLGTSYGNPDRMMALSISGLS
jgi:hypothetical protein